MLEWPVNVLPVIAADSFLKTRKQNLPPTLQLQRNVIPAIALRPLGQMRSLITRLPHRVLRVVVLLATTAPRLSVSQPPTYLLRRSVKIAIQISPRSVLRK